MAFEITLERMIIFFLILCVGFAAGKLSIITRDYLPQLAKLITKVFLPVLLFWSTFHGATWQMVADNALAIVFSVVFYASSTAVTFLIAKVMRIRPDRDRVFMLCFVFGNTGFVGMPLLSALFPARGFVPGPFLHRRSGGVLDVRRLACDGARSKGALQPEKLSYAEHRRVGARSCLHRASGTVSPGHLRHACYDFKRNECFVHDVSGGDALLQQMEPGVALPGALRRHRGENGVAARCRRAYHAGDRPASGILHRDGGHHVASHHDRRSHDREAKWA